MQRRRFGRTGLEVPQLTFGGGWVGGLLIRGSEAEREGVLNRALGAGIDWVDTAALYGNGVSETVIGEWLRTVPAEPGARASPPSSTSTRRRATSRARSSAPSPTACSGSGSASVPVLILHSRIVGEPRPGRDKRSLEPQEVLGAGGIADIMDKLRSEGLVRLDRA